MATGRYLSSVGVVIPIVSFSFFSLFLANCEETVKIKIVDSPALSRFTSSSSQQKLTLRTQPANITGPPHLRQLNGSCFEGTERGYKYRVCPFQNVTQKEERQSWMSYHGVLGVWQDWIVENDTFVGLNFVMGEQCGAVDREAKVMFNCSTKARVHNITEPSTCSYTIWMDTPIACFKGAMQVYHVLTEKQLEEWDKTAHEYYSNEITFQGLTKRRRSILIDAGLYYPPKSHLETNTKPSEEKPLLANDDHKAGDKSSELVECQEERQTLKQENEVLKMKLREINIRIIDVVKVHPDVATLLNYNNTVNGSHGVARDTTEVASKSNITVTEAKNKVTVHKPPVAGFGVEEHKSNRNDAVGKQERSPRNGKELVAGLHVNEDAPLLQQN